MKTFSKIAVLFALLLLIVPLSVSAQSATTGRTVTITEETINDSYRVTNPYRRTISNMSVDLQDGQAVISLTYTVRPPRGAATTTYSVVSVWTPRITNGRVYWTMISTTANGQPASQDLINQINASIGASWRNYIRGQHPGRVSSVSVTEDMIVLTVG